MKTSKQSVIIDRLVGEFAVVEYGDGKTFNLPKVMLPKSVKEGDIIKLECAIEEDKTSKRKSEMENLAKKLFK